VSLRQDEAITVGIAIGPPERPPEEDAQDVRDGERRPDVPDVRALGLIKDGTPDGGADVGASAAHGRRPRLAVVRRYDRRSLRNPSSEQTVVDARATAVSAERGLRDAVWVALGLVVVLFVGLAVANEVTRLDDEGLRLQAGWLVVAVVGFLALQLTHTELWRWELRALGHPLQRDRGYAIWSVSAVARYVPTSMLMPTLRIALSQREGVPKRITLASMIYEAALALTGAIVVASYFLIQLPALEDRSSRWLVLVVPVVAVAALHPRVFGPATAFALRRLGKEPLPLTLPASKLVLLAAMYAGSFLLAGVSLYALGQALYPLDAGDLPRVLGAFAIGFSASVLAFILPGGLGARELALVAALRPVMPAGVGLAVAIAARLTQVVIEIALAVLTPALAARRRRFR
jgi:glycosyltransferase 2 family protein